VNETQKYLEEAKKIDGARPETYYNEAILTHEFRAKRAGDKAIPVLEKAAGQYRDFVTKAGDEPVFGPAVKRSNERITDIEDTIKFLREGAQAEKDAEEARKAAEAEKKIADAQAKADEAEKKAADAKAPPADVAAKPGAKPGDKPAAPAAKPADKKK